ncbi:histidine kinase [Bryobacterales bacterium F-183]|nr:histidine kinase [Bryobacterales bacterium F-183]
MKDSTAAAASTGRSAPSDLTTCDREPIHIPGSIQPHGILLSLDHASFRVLQASANAIDLFGVPAEELIGRTLSEVLLSRDAGEMLEAIERAVLESTPVYLASIGVRAGGGNDRLYRAVAHLHRQRVIVELEEASTGTSSISFQNLYPLVRTFMDRLQGVATIPELAQMAADEVRSITGFERSLVYRFDPDWNGNVIAESCGPEFQPYLDLWFPASDIPAQARELYRINRLRLIADTNYQPVPLVPPLDPETNAPLDLSFSTLRSVSPVHIEYLNNMGLRASMSISVIRDGKLWGLISLHNRSPKTVPFEVRVACDFLGQALSTHLAAKEGQAEYEHRLYLKSITAKLLGYMAEEDRFIDGLVNHPDELLTLTDAAGAAVLVEGKCIRVGKAPAEPMIREVAEWLNREHATDEIFATDGLPSSMPGGEALRETASGVLAISISKLYNSYVMWFRPEVVRTVTWGGDPNKPVEPGNMRIHPRKSFEAWKETVRGRSFPWRQSEVEAASELRNALVGVVLRKAEELAALSAELQRSNKELEAFSYSVSHDLRAPFRHIVGYAHLLEDHLGDKADETAIRFLNTIAGAAHSAGTLVDNLLNFSRVGRAALHPIPVPMETMVEEIRQELMELEPEDRDVEWDVGPLPVVECDPVLMRMVWMNLLSNAVKYSRKRSKALVKVRCETSGDWHTFSVADNGAGFKQKYAGKLFGVFQRLHSQEEFEGTGIGLANVRRAVGKHGGRTWAEGKLDEGAVFWFTLPVVTPAIQSTK